MSVLSNLEKGLMDLSDVSYNSIDKLMRRLAKDHDITPRELHDRFKSKHKMIPDDWAKKQMNEGSLHKWFSGSKSKDGKPGWVQSDGSPCANEPGETKTPKCYSSAKKASMSKKELRSADARKSRQDPGQQQKSGAAKPTYVKTDSPKKMKKLKEEKKKEEINEELPKFNPLAGLADIAIRGISGAARGLSRGGAVRKIGAGGSAMRAGSAGSDSKRETTKEESSLEERVGGAGTLVRQGVKHGGKSGGRAVQKGTTAATAKGKEMAANAKKGGEGAGKNEVRGAAIGGTLGALGGTLVPDGPAMVAGEIAGGYLGSKVGGKIGKQFDKKKKVEESNWRGELTEVLGTALAGTKGAMDAEKGSKVKKAIGSGAGYAVGAKGGEIAGSAAGGAVGSAVGNATLPVVGGLAGKAVGSTIGKFAGGVTGGLVGSKVGNKVVGGKNKNEEVEVTEAEDKKGKGSGTKDACYSKVKSRYSVWPSAYASGALVKCRKVGAANWGNSTKKEGMEEFYNLPELTEAQIGALKYAGYEVEVIDEACWKGYEKKGMKTMFGKRYPNCVKKEEVEVEGYIPLSDKKKKMITQKGNNIAANAMDDDGDVSDDDMPKYRRAERLQRVGTDNFGKGFKKGDPKKGIRPQIRSSEKSDGTAGKKYRADESYQLDEVVRTKPQTGNMYQVIFGWRGKMMMVKLFFPDSKVPNRQKVASTLDKMYPGSQLRSYSISVVDYDDPYINVGVDEETHLHEKKEEERYCRLCEKREPRSKCAYGGGMWDKYSVENLSDTVRDSAASDSGISESDDYNDEVKSRMNSDKKRRITQSRNKMRAGRYRQNKNLPSNQNEEFVDEDMSGMSQKSGDKRSTDSGAGMTSKGVAKYNRRTGGNLKTAVTTPPSKLKPGSKAAGRRKSFCARSRSWTGERGKAARKRWNC